MVMELKQKQFISNFNLAQAHVKAQAEAEATKNNEAIDKAIYESDEFRMYGLKIKRCTRMRSHDWTQCPFAHRGEKAQRRDPLKYPYIPVVCPAFRDGICPNGDNCQLAHGVFEFWLHPAKYRTHPCSAGKFCTRRVCFFAHSPDQLRSSKPKFNSPNPKSKGKMTMMNGGGDNHKLMMVVGSLSGSGEGSRPMQAHFVDPSPLQLEGFSSLLKSLRTLKMREAEARATNKSNNNNNNSFFSGGVEMADSYLSHFDWISKLLK
ncbi:Zinc finger CCCH domain-containing protein 49 [Hibiscus syriacus]|uniref:Zinc finger CCCH domain-containing protein 49 n=1 Tax=Hibiscus syriacus TaxID=106335 RepID=A0A6A2X6T4_HIBSY|nr:zinc finger CCCH domain-containing protein 54-like [Hibiscus syriacus]KAE8670911.1 Zinc finger CCCH domain-containing protein 49 [Hibiscus syriacus]